MRFARLQVPAFGPFTNLDLQFKDPPGDLHVIHGPNEAGKSSLLRAIRDLLFGIHVQSADNFLHEYTALKIRGEVVNRAGQRLTFQRRKGSKNTLLDAEGNPLPDDALFPFLGGVDLAYFSAMFGLGPRELHEGAQQLLRGEGQLGHALFSASLGGTPIQKVLETLGAEADRLFKGRASANVSIRPAARRYAELIGHSRNALVKPEAWSQVEKDFTDACDRKQTLEDEIAGLDRELAWTARCEGALPAVGKLIQELITLSQLPPLPDLGSDFVPRARAARKTVEDAQTELRRLENQIERLERQRSELSMSPAVLAQANRLDELHQDLSAHRERKQSLVDAKAKLAGLEPALRAGMKNLQLAGGFAVLEHHRIGSHVRLACEQTAKQLRDALAGQDQNHQQAAELKQQLAEREAELRKLPETDLAGLRGALAVAAGATDADKTFATSEREVKRLMREAADQHHRLLDVPRDLAATARLAVPAIATIRKYQERMSEIERSIKAEQDTLHTANSRREGLNAELVRLQRQGELPSEDALRQAREHRDRGWKLVLAEWKAPGAHEEFVPGTPLEEAFPQAIVKADDIADRLRLQAEAVAQAEERRLQLAECEKRMRDAQTKIDKLQGTVSEWQKAWVGEWAECGITPRSPAEMTEWRDEWVEFARRLDLLRAAEESLAGKARQIQAARQRLAAVLGDSEANEFSLLFEAARSRVQREEESAGSRREIARQLERLERDRAELEGKQAGLAAAVTAARVQWAAQCTAVGLPETTSPDAGLALLDERKALLAKFDDWLELSDKARSAIEAIKQYEQAVAAQAAALGIEGATTEALEGALWKALTNARKAQTRHEQLGEQTGTAADELKTARLQAGQAAQSLTALARLAGLAAAEDLEPLLAHLETRDATQTRIRALRDTLGGFAFGQDVDAFVARVRAEDPESLARRKSEAERLKSDKTAALETAQESLFQLGNRRKEVEEAGDAAADFRQQAEACAASLRRDAARFLRLRLAMHLLQNQIEQFRKENQGPLLAKSGVVFKTITRGAFTELAAEFNAEDIPVLVGVRPDDSKVGVDGMSDGTRDQLYLALRLAALEHYLEAHEPMPLILDDLLMTFDNDRARAILPQLQSLARRTQVFLFTHHDHLVELCRQTLGEGQFQLHRLGSQSMQARC